MSSKKEKSKESKPKQIVSQSLAVKYRPRRFKDLVGQDSAVSIIRGMFKSGKFPGALLIEGQTGGGKTTVARMLLAYLNCDTHNACGKCDSCLMGVETHPDLVYVNAGSDGGVDNMRRLQKLAQLTPRFNKRVIIIDECVTAETPIVVDVDGTTVTAEQLHSNLDITHVLSRNMTTGENEMKRILHRFILDKPSEDIIDITLEDGTTLSVTANHPVWSITRNSYIRADELTEDDELLPLQSCTA